MRFLPLIIIHPYCAAGMDSLIIFHEAISFSGVHAAFAGDVEGSRMAALCKSGFWYLS